MSGRRSGNRIRGPQSALTDFLASNNISAAQIRNDFIQRQSLLQNVTNAEDEEPEEQVEVLDEEELEELVRSTKKRKRTQAEAIDKIKKSKKQKKPQADDSEDEHKLKKSKKSKKGHADESEDDYIDSEDEPIKHLSYKKSKPAPGQFANCEVCSKRFTVTPYSKEGPDGGLLCTPCGKALAKDANAGKKPAVKPIGRKRRQKESDKLDGMAMRGAKSLQQMCIERVVQNHQEVEELGDLPGPILERLSAIFSKRRVLKPNTLSLFLRPNLHDVVLHDAAYLDIDNYKEIFAVVPELRKLVIGNACQFKDAAVEYMLERCKNINDLRLYAPNLVTNPMWTKLFEKIGKGLQVLKLKWLDAAFEDENVAEIVQYCTNLERLKFETCRRLTETSVAHISRATTLQHLSLQIGQPVSNEVLLDLVNTLGPNLRTLSLKKFLDADDTILQAIHEKCKQLSKLRFSENDTATNAAFTALFTSWVNPPLQFIDVNCARDVDNNNPDGPEDAIGIAGTGFKAMMAHSGLALQHLNVASCRHIDLAAFLDVFNGEHIYPALSFINISFCNRIDTTVIAGIFKSCPALKKLVAFGCFDIGEIVVPRDIALIGIPRAQDAIEQFGTGLNVEEALVRMIDVGA